MKFGVALILVAGWVACTANLWCKFYAVYPETPVYVYNLNCATESGFDEDCVVTHARLALAAVKGR
jgi:hypothetical protein